MDVQRIAVVGATGMVGQTLLAQLPQSRLAHARCDLLASARSAGTRIEAGGELRVVEDLANYDFSSCDWAFFTAGSQVSAQWVPKALAAGCRVIDNTAYFRQDAQVPLVIPEVNAWALTPDTRLIANPNCSTIPLLLALKPLVESVGVARVQVATYQSVSGAGRQAVERLYEDCASIVNGADRPDDPASIAFDVVPMIDQLMDNAYTREEMKMHWETQKILADEQICVSATAARVPVVCGHSEAVSVTLKSPLSVASARALLESAARCVVAADPAACMTTKQAAGSDSVHISRLRCDHFDQNTLLFWLVSDNLLTGAAVNAIRIAEWFVESKK